VRVLSLSLCSRPDIVGLRCVGRFSSARRQLCGSRAVWRPVSPAWRSFSGNAPKPATDPLRLSGQVPDRSASATATVLGALSYRSMFSKLLGFTFLKTDRRLRIEIAYPFRERNSRYRETPMNALRLRLDEPRWPVEIKEPRRSSSRRWCRKCRPRRRRSLSRNRGCPARCCPSSRIRRKPGSRRPIPRYRPDSTPRRSFC